MVKTTTKTSKKAAGEEFELDPELLEEEYNQVRRPVLPYGIILNENPAGILIPVDQIKKAGWIGAMPEEEDLHTASLSEETTGLLIKEARILVLAYVPEYIRYKSDVEETGGTVVGLYEQRKKDLDKKTMEVCSEHAIVFLDEHNQPLHTTPIVVRFKNVALWSFKSVREEFYRQLEKTFALFCGTKFSGKNDKWRSLGVLECKFKGVKEGTGKNKHYCCKTVDCTIPTVKNLPQVFLGTPALKNKVWDLHDNIAGFTNPVLEASSDVKALPPEVQLLLPGETASSKGSKARKVVAEVVDDDPDLDELEDLDEADDDDSDDESETEDDDDFDDDDLELDDEE